LHEFLYTRWFTVEFTAYTKAELSKEKAVASFRQFCACTHVQYWRHKL